MQGFPKRIQRPIHFILLFLLLLEFTGCTPAQKPISDNQGVVYFLNQVEDSARENRWKEAAGSVNRLEAAWEKDRDRLTAPRTKENVKKFEASLKELREEVQEKDKEDVNEEIGKMRDYYRNITGP